MDKRIKSFRIAIIDPVGAKAGLDHYDKSLADVLNEYGLTTCIFSNFSDEDNSINQFRFSFDKSLLSALFILRSFIGALQICRKAKAEIIILHVFHSSVIDRLFTRLVKFFRFRLCVIVHDAESFIYENSDPSLIVQKADWIVVHNKYTAGQLGSRIADSDRPKINVIPHGNFLDVVKPVHIQNSEFRFNAGNVYLLFFGMLKKSKGLEVLLEAMKFVPDNVHLIVAGRPRDIDTVDYLQLSKKFQLESRVQFIFRYISNEERNMLFTKCQIAVLPYHRIYQSGILLMAMSYGLPVIVSDLPSNKEIITESNGEIFISGNAQSLAEKINLLAGDEALRSAKSAKAKEYVVMNHDWKIIGKSFINLFN